MVPLPDRPPAHPWNRSFEWRAHQPALRLLSEAQASRFDRDGFLVLPDVFDPATIDEVVAETDEYESEVDAGLRLLDDERFSIAEAGAITFATHLVARSERLRRFACHPFFAGLGADLVGPDVNLYWDQAVYKEPEKPRRFPWHQDNGYAFVEPQQYLTCWVALTDATASNGCPHAVPGVHLGGTLAHTYVEPLGWECLHEPDPAGATITEVAAGGVVVLSSLTPHLTGPNTTDATRKAYILQYAPAGAAVLTGEPPAAPTGRTPAHDPALQFPIVRGGEAVDG